MDYDTAPLFPGAELFPSSGFHIPWLGYLSAPLHPDFELPPEILTELTPDGGLLMTATEDRLDPTAPEHWRRARIIAETMIARDPDSKAKPVDRPLGHLGQSSRKRSRSDHHDRGAPTHLNHLETIAEAGVTF